MIPFSYIESLPEFQGADEETRAQVKREYAADLWQEISNSDDYLKGTADQKKALEASFAKTYGEAQKEPRYDILGGLKDIGKAIYDLPTQVGGAVGRLLDDPEVQGEFADKLAKKADERTRQRAAELSPSEAQSKIVPLPKFLSDSGAITRGDIQSAASSAGFSAVSMGAGIVGGTAGKVVGSVITIPLSPFASLIGKSIGGTAGQLAGSGYAAYRMDKSMISQELLDAAESVKGSPLTKEEIKIILAEGSEAIHNHALWEAGPEAVGNAIQLSGLGMIFKGAVGNKVKKVIGGFLGNIAAEIATETVTQKGQAKEEISLGVREGEEPTWGKAMREVAPTTIALSGGMGGAGYVAGKTVAATRPRPEIDTKPAHEPVQKKTKPASILEADSLDDAIEKFKQSVKPVQFQPYPIPSTAPEAARVFAEAGPSQTEEELNKRESELNRRELRQKELEEAFKPAPFQPYPIPSTAPEAARVFIEAGPNPTEEELNKRELRQKEFEEAFKQPRVSTFIPPFKIDSRKPIVDNKQSIAEGQEFIPEPTEKQKEAGNYKKPHVLVDGLNISIENPVGSVRSGVSKDAEPWSIEMKSDYGYIRGTKGADKDHLDVFIKPGYKGGASQAFVVDQYDEQGKFDEHKVVIGAQNKEEAQEIYNSNYEEGWDRGKAVIALPMEDFKDWVKSPAPKKSPLENDKDLFSLVKKRVAEIGGNVEGFDKGHAHNVMEYAKALGQRVGLSEKEMADLERAAGLHDIGKVTIPEPILNKDGKLAEDERSVIEKHTEAVEQYLKDEPETIKLAAIQHHEKIDGTGYPAKLKGEEITKLAKVIAVADVFDALVTARPYKPSWTPEEALNQLYEFSGNHLDKDLVKAFDPIVRPVSDREKSGAAERTKPRNKVVTWEAIPSTKTGINIPVEKRREYSDIAKKIIVDENNRDVIADKIGMPSAGIVPGSVAYAGAVNPNNLSMVGDADEVKSKTYAKSLQYLFKQDAVPWIAQNDQGDTIGAEIVFGRGLKDENKVLEVITKELGEDAGFTKLDDNTIVVADFTGTEGFQEKIKAAFSGFDDAQIKIQNYSSEYSNVHDWGKDPDGNSLLADPDIASIEGLPELLKEKRIEFDIASAETREATPKQFDKNKLFTADMVERARKHLKESRGQLSSGFDPTLLSDVITIGGAYFEQGVRDFSTWSAHIAKELGDGYKAYLKEGYEIVSNHPAFMKDKADAFQFVALEPQVDKQGKYKGTPPNVKTKKDLKKMRSSLKGLLEEGELVTLQAGQVSENQKLSTQESYQRASSRLSDNQRKATDRLLKSGKIVLMSNEEAIKEAERAGYTVGDGYKPLGIELQGKTILVPENIPEGELWGSMRHAVGTHIGKMMGNSEEFNRLKESILNRRDEQSATGEAIRQAISKIPPTTDPAAFSEEILAYMVSNSRDVGVVRRVIAIVKNMVSRLGVSHKIFNEEDLLALADVAIRREANSSGMFDSGSVKFQMAGPQGMQESLRFPVNETTRAVRFLKDAGISKNPVDDYGFSSMKDYVTLAMSHGFEPEVKPLGLVKHTEAMDMAKKGEDRTVIWNKTNWWEMLPGEWQYEIPETIGSFNAKQWRTQQETTVGSLYKSEDLYRAYPELKDIKVVKTDRDVQGVFTQDGTILLNEKMKPQEASSVLLHEIQHYIQNEEGFSKGGNVPDQVKKNRDLLHNMDQTINRISAELSWLATEPDKLIGERKAKYEKLLVRRIGLVDQYRRISNGFMRKSFDDYRLLAGEAQARLVQKRQGMTAEQRRKEPPWVTLEGMLMGEGLMGFNQKPEDVLVKTLEDAPVEARNISGSGTQPAVSFLARIAAKYDMEGIFDKVATWGWDRDRSIYSLQKKLGRQVPERDYSLVRGLMGKVIANDIKMFDKETLQPFLEFLAKKNITIEELEELAHAQHAPERNLQMRRVNARRYIDSLLSNMTDVEKRPWQQGLGTIDEEFKANNETRNQRRDKTITLLENLASDIQNQRVKLDAAADALNNRVFTQAEIKKGTPAVLQGRLEKLYDRLEKRESIVSHWNDVKGRLSGMTDAQAKAIELKYKNRVGLYEATKRMRDINRQALDTNFKAGEFTQEEYDAIVNTYKYHIPLMREDLDNDKTPTGKAGVGPLGKPFKIAYGSTRDVSNILSYVVDRSQAALTRKRKLEAGRVLYDMIQANPDENFWSVVPMEKAAYHDHEGNVRFYPDQQLNQKYQTYVKVDGVKHIIEVNRDNPVAVRFMEALNRPVTELGPVLRAVGSITRILARLNTTYTPEFALSNFSRDLQTAMANMQSTEAKGLQGKVFKNIRHAIKGIYLENRGKPSGDWGAIYKDAASQGVIMGWAPSYDKIADLAKKIESDLDIKKGGHKIKANVQKIGEFIENANLAVENGVRVATYQALLEHGVDKKNAARVASSLTVDFTKHGTVGPTINSLWMFSNAAIQGNIRVLTAMKSPTVRKIASGIVGFGILNNFLGAMTGGEDEDGELYYDKLKRLQPGLFERNMVFMIPGSEGKYIKIPAAYGYNIFYSLGNEVASIMRGRDINESAARWGTTVMNNINPLAAGTLLQTISPTIADPFVQLRENKAWHGGDLMPPLNPWMEVPDSERYFKSVNPEIKAVTDWLNRNTGGSKFKSGHISVSPESIEMILETFTGGAGNFIKDLVSLPVAAYKKDLAIKKVPFARRFVGEKPDWTDSRSYFINKEEMQIFVKELDFYEGEDRKALIQDPKFRLVSPYKATEKKLRKLYKQRKAIQEQGGNTDRIGSLIKQAQIEFNAEYNQVVGH